MSRKRAFFGLFSDHGWLDSWIVREKSDGENDFEKNVFEKNVSKKGIFWSIF